MNRLPRTVTDRAPMESAKFQSTFCETAFDALAATYDETFTDSSIGRAQRNSIRRELHRAFRPGQRILEINCGTGVDAIDLALHGVDVLACDISSRMIEIANLRAEKALRNPSLHPFATFRVLATEKVGSLCQEGLTASFDGAFSNFAGLNCVRDLRAVARNLATLLKPGAPLLLCLFGRFCAWEVLWYLVHAKPAKALRRLRLEGDLALLAEGVAVRVHYPSVREVTRIFSPEFGLEKWKGVGVAVPPTYLEGFARRFPALLKMLAKLDRWLERCPAVRSTADHVLLTFKRRQQRLCENGHCSGQRGLVV